MSDHYRWGNETARANLLHEVVDTLHLIAQPPPPPARQRPPILRRYGVAFCSACNFEATICRCGLGASDAPSGDARAADLERRVRDVKERK